MEELYLRSRTGYTLSEELSSFVDILPDVRCHTCNKVIGHLYEKYTSLLSQGKAHLEIIKELGLKRKCCILNTINPPQTNISMRPPPIETYNLGNQSIIPKAYIFIPSTSNYRLDLHSTKKVFTLAHAIENSKILPVLGSNTVELSNDFPKTKVIELPFTYKKRIIRTIELTRTKEDIKYIPYGEVGDDDDRNDSDVNSDSEDSDDDFDDDDFDDNEFNDNDEFDDENQYPSAFDDQDDF